MDYTILVVLLFKNNGVVAQDVDDSISKSRSSLKRANKENHLSDNAKTLHAYALWHHRLRHAPMSTLTCIAELSPLVNKKGEIWITCLVAKFAKLPFPMTANNCLT